MHIRNVKKGAWLPVLLLLLAACNKDKVKCTGSSEKTFTATGFNKIKVADNFHVTVTSGTAFSVKATGCT